MNDEKVEELLNENNFDYEYNTEKTNLELTQFKTNSRIIEMGVLFGLLFTLLVIVALLKSKKRMKK